MSGLAIQRNSAHGEAQDYEVRICQNSGFAHGTKNIMKKRLLYISKEKICRSPGHNKVSVFKASIVGQRTVSKLLQ